MTMFLGSLNIPGRSIRATTGSMLEVKFDFHATNEKRATVMAARLLILIVVLKRLRCQFLLLTFATGEHHAKSTKAPHGEGGGFGDGRRCRNHLKF